MRFTIEGSRQEGTPHVWNESTACPILDRLIARADEAGHTVTLWDADLIDESKWFAEARDATRDLIKELCELARSSAWITTENGRPNHQITDPTEAERALRIANTPLKVLVESRLRDGALLETATRLLGPPVLRNLWINPPTPPVVELVHAGGIGDMPAFLDAEAVQAKKANLPLRMIAVVDSDRDRPDAEPSKDAIRVQETAMRHRAHAVILQKRTGENYIPDFHWQAELERYHETSDRRTVLNDLLAMSPEKRDYCDMEALKCKQLKRHDVHGRPYHLQLLLQRVCDTQDPSDLAAMANDLRRQDHTHDLTAILERIEQER